MNSHMTSIRVVALLLTVCLLLATNAQCRIVDGGDKKVNLPNGLCAYKPDWSFCKLDIPLCYCCMAGDPYCYATMELCKQDCRLAPAPGAASP